MNFHEKYNYRFYTAFLVDRVQGVVVEGFRSQEDKVLSGVPQGTVLEPLLFLLYINVVTSQVRLFADDCVYFYPIWYRTQIPHYQHVGMAKFS